MMQQTEAGEIVSERVEGQDICELAQVELAMIAGGAGTLNFD